MYSPLPPVQHAVPLRGLLCQPASGKSHSGGQEAGTRSGGLLAGCVCQSVGVCVFVCACACVCVWGGGGGGGVVISAVAGVQDLRGGGCLSVDRN